MQVGGLHDFAHRGVADASSRIVDDASKRLLVVGICHHAEVGNNILDFLALVKRQTAIDAVWNTLLAHLFLEGTALCVGAIQDGEVRVLSALLTPNALDVVAHNHCFLLVTIGRLQRKALTLLILAEDILANLSLVLTNQAVGSLHNELCGAVVLLQFEESRVLVLLLEVEDVVDVGATERVDALSIVAYDTDTTVLKSQLQHNLLLGKVRILILVHQHILEALYILLANVLMLTEQQPGLHQQVVKVHSVSLSAALHVPLIYIGNLRTFLLRIVSCPRAQFILLWQQQMVLGHRDAVGN